MLDVRSPLAGGADTGHKLTTELLPQLLAAFPLKFFWFARHGYVPHSYQQAFHGASHDGRIVRNRHLVAGRRGGKTLSAAWEVLFYCLHPAQFHLDMHGVESDKPLWIWVLTKDYPTGFASLQTLLQVMRQVGLTPGKDYVFNKTERRIEFPATGTLIQFKTADDPQSLRGAGLDILWMDEAAFISTREAYDVTSPALASNRGAVITTTTPHGKNWLWEEFFDGPALTDPDEFRVQYTSLDNPYFAREEWERYKRRYHPIMFKQEFLASFEAMHGLALQGDWLKFWTSGDPSGEIVSIRHLVGEDGKFNLDVYVGVDPAVSLADTADQFAMAAIGVTKERDRAFLLETFLGRLAFPDQLDKVQEWILKWRPIYVGIEDVAYQKALAQQAARLDGFPNIVPMPARGQKNDRILAMSPAFKIGKIRILQSHSDFIDQWVSFDPEKKNQRDDLLDAVEIALRTAGVLLPVGVAESLIEDEPKPTDSTDVWEMAKAQIRDRMDPRGPYDPELGDQA